MLYLNVKYELPTGQVEVSDESSVTQFDTQELSGSEM